MALNLGWVIFIHLSVSMVTVVSEKNTDNGLFLLFFRIEKNIVHSDILIKSKSTFLDIQHSVYIAIECD